MSQEVIQTKAATMTIRTPVDLDHFEAEQLRDRADQILEQKNIREIIFDFRKTEFMDSSGIGLVMGRYRKMRLAGGRVSIIHARERIWKILQMSGVSKVVPIERKKTWK